MSRQDARAGTTASVRRVFDEHDVASLDGGIKKRVICDFLDDEEAPHIQRSTVCMIHGVDNRPIFVKSRAPQHVLYFVVVVVVCSSEREVAVFDPVRCL